MNFAIILKLINVIIGVLIANKLKSFGFSYPIIFIILFFYYFIIQYLCENFEIKVTINKDNKKEFESDK